MTPIQQHETELREMMERAGLIIHTANTRGIRAGSADGAHGVEVWYGVTDRGYADCSAGDGKPIACTEHPDPRVALRHCLEMAGLLRPPIYTEVMNDGSRLLWRVVIESHGRTGRSEWRDGMMDNARYLQAMAEAGAEVAS